MSVHPHACGEHTITNDFSNLNDFIDAAARDLTNSPRYAADVAKCRTAVDSNCGGWDWLGGCKRDNEPKCENGSVDWSIPTQFRALAATPQPPATTPNGSSLAGWLSGPQRLANWQANARAPKQGRLLDLEYQYRGLVADLAAQGVTFQSRPAAHL